MTARPTGFLKGAVEDGDVASAIQEYEYRYGGEARGGLDLRKAEYRNFAKLYFDLVTDFYEYGWNRSFHFAARARSERFAASLTRHEHYLAHMLGLRSGMVALDLGCGIGGPLRQIARFTGAKVVGVNISSYQLERARKYTEDAGLGHLAEYVEGDFMKMDFPDDSFDAVYSIETTCCAPDKAGAFGEAFRVLKPGGRFGTYEYCLTDRFDAEDSEHLGIKADLELGGALSEIAYPLEVDDALREVGFEFVEGRDLAVEDPSGIPWYEPLTGAGPYLETVRSCRRGRVLTHALVGLLERLGIVPKGTLQVSALLNMAALAFTAGGQLGIFTPMYFALARKPVGSCSPS